MQKNLGVRSLSKTNEVTVPMMHRGLHIEVTVDKRDIQTILNCKLIYPNEVGPDTVVELPQEWLIYLRNDLTFLCHIGVAVRNHEKI